MTLRFIPSKKGFEIAFNWIFVLIAGFIILIFFFTFMRNHYSDVKVDESVTSQSNVQFILTASQGSKNSEKPYLFPSKITFSCTDGTSQYLVEGSNVFSSYNHISLFTPKSLEKGEFLVRTESFDAPFSVMPTTFITNKKVQYVFVGTPESVPYLSKLYSSLSKNSTRVYSPDIASFSNKNFDTVIFIANKDELPPSLTLDSSFSESDYPNLFLVTYEFFSLPGGAGKLEFYRYGASGSYDDSGFEAYSESFFLNDLQLKGAVYSGDGDIYSCQFDKMLDKLNLISSLHKGRILEMKRAGLDSSSCESEYNGIVSELSNIESIIEAKIFNEQTVGSLFESIQSTSALNARILQTSCPPIY